MSETHDPDAINIFSKLDKGPAFMKKAGAPQRTGYTDTVLSTLASDLKLPKSVKLLPSHPGLLYNFFNFYFNGALPFRSSPHEVVFPILSSLISEEKQTPTYFFSDDYYQAEGFYKSATLPSPLPSLTISQNGGTVGYTLPTDLTADQIKSLKTLYLDADTLNQTDFCKHVQKYIKDYNTQEMTSDNYTIMKLAGFLAMLLFRGIAKDAVQLARGVNKKLIKDHIHTLAEWPLYNGYAPPCKTCIEHCATDFDKGNSPGKNMMCLILNRWRETEAGEKQSTGIIPRLQATILTHTAGNGLGIIILLHMATEVLGISIKEMADYTLTQRSKTSWLMLATFIETYMAPEKDERTFLWARLIDDGYFTEYAAKTHPYLAGMFAGIIDTQQLVGTIKDAAWFQSKRMLAEAGYRWGAEVFAYLSKVKDEGVTRSSNIIANNVAQRIEAPHLLDTSDDPLAGIITE